MTDRVSPKKSAIKSHSKKHHKRSDSKYDSDGSRYERIYYSSKNSDDSRSTNYGKRSNLEVDLFNAKNKNGLNIEDTTEVNILCPEHRKYWKVINSKKLTKLFGIIEKEIDSFNFFNDTQEILSETFWTGKNEYKVLIEGRNNFCSDYGDNFHMIHKFYEIRMDPSD